MIVGFLVNRFRGDPSLFDDGMKYIETKTGWLSFGLVPHFDDAIRLPAEDAFTLTRQRRDRAGGAIRIAVPILPHIANFDDFDPLEAEPGIDLIRVWPGKALPGDADLIILPGTKATLADLKVFREAGFDVDLAAHIRRGAHVLGICGGFQMLGRAISDPEGVEGRITHAEGLGYLDIETTLGGEKRLKEVAGTSFFETPVQGYEMHLGVTSGPATARPFVRFDDGRTDGAVAPNGRIVGTYLHGLFSLDVHRASWIARLGGAPSTLAYETEVDAVLDGLAAHLEAHLDIDALIRMAR
jgi:adenosylcobyric acid synthase